MVKELKMQSDLLVSGKVGRITGISKRGNDETTLEMFFPESEQDKMRLYTPRQFTAVGQVINIEHPNLPTGK